MQTLTKDFKLILFPGKDGLKDLILSLEKFASFRESLVSAVFPNDNLNLFRRLYHEYGKMVRSAILRLSGPENCDDLTQEVFVRIWKGLPKLRRLESVSHWIYKIAINVAYDNIKQTSREAKNFRQYAADAGLHCQNNNFSTADYREVIDRGLDSLSLDHRTILVMHDLEGLTEKELADILDIPTGTVKSRLFYARNQMRSFLKEEGIDYHE